MNTDNTDIVLERLAHALADDGYQVVAGDTTTTRSQLGTVRTARFQDSSGTMVTIVITTE